ncbi:MAG: 2'-5' RNA ligase family protein [Leptolyngbyaceae cyanobacterium bins.302]|nr:2'-5' RNA ligase family protein [Leptolyngbyaceae cyanobacterium bins.302]
MTSEKKQRFFVALLPPQDIQAYANGIKQEFADRYESRAAQKSPPHITLQAPFEWQWNELAQLEQQLSGFAAQQNPISITLDGFAAFPPRVLFIQVQRSSKLVTLQAELAAWLEEKLNLVDPRSTRRSFQPHMTVAFRDLTKQNFRLAWQEFQGRSLHFEWTATHLTLLVHTGQQWIVHQTFPFQAEA